MKSPAESISRQLRGWAESLQNGDIHGQRHLTDRSKTAYEHKKKAEAFMTKLRHMNEEAEKKRREWAPG